MDILLPLMFFVMVLVAYVVFIKVIIPKHNQNTAMKAQRLEEVYATFPPEEREIEYILKSDFFRQDSYNLKDSVDARIEKLKDTTAKVILVSEAYKCVIVITNRICYFLFNGDTLYKDPMASCANLSKNIVLKEALEVDSYTKKSNVVGSAVVGGVIAGGAGAVVGAAHAMNTNANGGKVVTKHTSVGYGLKVASNFSSVWYSECYLSRDILNQFGTPKQAYIDDKGFANISTYGQPKTYMDNVVDYLRRVVDTLYQNTIQK